MVSETEATQAGTGVLAGSDGGGGDGRNAVGGGDGSSGVGGGGGGVPRVFTCPG